MKHIDNKPPIILVLGMHRSGTSLVANLVSEWGAYFSSDLLEANEYNTEGYWEYKPLTILNDKILKYSGNKWYAPINELDVDELILFFGEEAIKIIASMDKQGEIWCWKDPRIIFLLPFWLKILEGRSIAFIHTIRHPDSVSQSLFQRNKMPKQVALALWSCSILSILEFQTQTSLPFFPVYFENLIANPYNETQKLVNFLDSFSNKKTGKSKMEKIAGYINSSLDHHAKKKTSGKNNNTLYKTAGKANINSSDLQKLSLNEISFKEILHLYDLSQIHKESTFSIQLFISENNEDFTQEKSIKTPFIENQSIYSFDLANYKAITSIRLDPLENWVMLRFIKMELILTNDIITIEQYSSHNGYQLANNSILFNHRDPQIIFQLNELQNSNFIKVIFHVEFLNTDEDTKRFFIDHFDDIQFKILSKENLNLKEDKYIKSLEIQSYELRKDSLFQKGIIKKQQKFINEHRIKEKSLFSELTSLHSRIEELIKKNSSLEQKESDLEIKIQDILCDKDKTEKSFEVLLDKTKEDKKAFEILLKEKNQLTEQIKENETALSNFKKQFNELKSISENQEKNLSNLKRRIFELEKEINVYKNSFGYLILSKLLVGINFLFRIPPLGFFRYHFSIYRQIKKIKKSSLFDKEYYLKNNPDVLDSKISPYKHFLIYGGKEGRFPSAKFNTHKYLADHPEIIKLNINPLIHFLNSGEHKLNNEFEISLPQPKIVKDEVPIDFKILQNCKKINWDTFQKEYKIEGTMDDAINYYLKHWKNQSFVFKKFFDSKLYALNNPDVIKSGMNPLIHFILFGEKEGRIGYLDIDIYLTKGNYSFHKEKPSILIACHESSATGAPLVGLNIGIEFKERFNVFFFIQKEEEIHQAFIEHSCFVLSNFDLQKKNFLKILLYQINEKYQFYSAICNSILTHPVLEAASQLKIPTVSLSHEFSETVYPRSLAVDTVLNADRVIVPALLLKQSILDEFENLYDTNKKIIPNNIAIAPQGKVPFIPNLYGGNLSAVEIKKKLNIHDKETKIISGAGYIDIRKGVDLFINVAEKIAEKFKGKVKFIWVGDGKSYLEDRYALFLKIHFDKSNIKEDLLFLEHQKNLDSVLDITDCFLLTSRLDPFPNVIIDALQKDKYVSCFDKTTGCAEFIVQNNLNGSVIPYLDVHAMADEVVRYLNNNDTESLKGINKRSAESLLNFKKYVRIVEKEIQNAKAVTSKRIEIEDTINKSTFFDYNFFRLYPGEKTALDYYVKYSLKGCHLLNPKPGFSQKLWLKQYGGNSDYQVPLYEAIIKKMDPVTHTCFTLKGTIEKKNIGKIAIHVHLFYIELLEEIITHLNYIAFPFDLFITVCDNISDLQYQSLKEIKSVGKIEIIHVENIGRDIAPFLIHLKEVLFSGNYNIVGHFHSKKTNDAAEGLGDRWRKYLYTNLLGNTEYINEILNLFEEKTLGLVFSEEAYATDISRNKPFADEICREMNIPPREDYYLFPVGTMFWARPKALVPLFNCPIEKFLQPEPIPYDGSYMHALERLIPYVTELMGYNYKTVYVEGSRW